MPRHSKKKRTHRKRRQRGSGFMDWIKKKALPFVKKHQLLSRGVSLVNPLVGKAIGAVTGYGRRRRVGRGYRLAGSGARLAGGRRRINVY